MEQYDAFNQIYQTTRDALLRWLIPRVRSSADVEDITQEVYRKLYRALLKRSDVHAPERYVFGIAKKELARFYRRRAAQAEHEEPLFDTLPDESPSPESLALSREREREVWELVKREPLLSYQAFTLYYGFSVPTDAIAKELQLSEDAVRKRLSRTRQKLRMLLESPSNDASHAEQNRSHA